MRAMKTYAKKKECVNAPIGPFTSFSHCACGYNVRGEVVFSRRDAENAEKNTMGSLLNIFSVWIGATSSSIARTMDESFVSPEAWIPYVASLTNLAFGFEKWVKKWVNSSHDAR